METSNEIYYITHNEVMKFNNDCVNNIEIPNDFKVWLMFSNQIQSTGWARVEVKTNENISDSEQAYYAGLIEGYVTEQLITDHYFNKLSNYFDNEDEYLKRLINYVETCIKFIKQQIYSYRSTDPYWHNVALVLEQLTGLEDGYALKINNIKLLGPRIDLNPFSKVFLLNLLADIDVLEEVLKKHKINRLMGELSCSAIIKALSDGSNLLVAHNMWSSYQSMLRIVKKYNFNFHSTADSAQQIAGNCVSFSSYPAAILSLDDFYILSSGLVVQETTFEILNNKYLWQFVKPENSVFEFIRVLVANRLSINGEEWTRIFTKHNSGTYNSQFMIIDYNQFNVGDKPQNLKDNLLWIVEQLPGVTHARDMTHILRQQHYWASYNIPYFHDIYAKSGHSVLKQKFGNYFSHKLCARALIFAREQEKVTDIEALMKLMRYNHFTNDPLSQYPNCIPNYSADLAIAARNDLNDPNGEYTLPVLGFRCRGAIDVKITNKQMVENFEMYAISGPTNHLLPTFEWSTSLFKNLKHRGHPDIWNFKPLIIKWLNFTKS